MEFMVIWEEIMYNTEREMRYSCRIFFGDVPPDTEPLFYMKSFYYLFTA